MEQKDPLRDELVVGNTTHRLIHAAPYDQALREYRNLEPKLHEAVRESLAKEIEGGQLDEIQETAGWAKGRVASPSRNIGKSGGFRVIFLFLAVQQDIYLHTVYDHRRKADLSVDEKKALKGAAEAIRKSYTKELQP
jgi:hypothetical protein